MAGKELLPFVRVELVFFSAPRDSFPCSLKGSGVHLCSLSETDTLCVS